MIETNVISKLNATDTITAIVSDRISAARGTISDTFPRVYIESENDGLDTTHDGVVCNGIEMVRVFCLSKSVVEAINLAKATVTALHGQSGAWGDRYIQGAFLTEEKKDEHYDSNDDDITIYQRELVFRVFYNNN